MCDNPSIYPVDILLSIIDIYYGGKCWGGAPFWTWGCETAERNGFVTDEYLL